jgi:insertion element IS1 protein InsB
MPVCPRCQSSRVIRNGYIHNGKAKYACKDCQRQFVENPQSHRISDERRALVDKLLLERLSQAAIARVVGVSERWVNGYVSAKLRQVPQVTQVDSAVAAQKNAR